MVRLGAAIWVSLTIAGCVPTAKGLRGDHFFERGEYHEAARAYQDALEAGLPSAKPDRLLVRLSLAYLLDQRNARGENARTRATTHALTALQRLLREYPDSVERPIALALLDLLQRSRQLQSTESGCRDQLESLQAEADSCRQQAETLKGALETQEQRLSAASNESDQHATEIDELRTRIARQKKRIEELKRALAAFKQIDMQRSR